MAEDDRVGVREAPAHALEPPGGGARRRGRSRSARPRPRRPARAGRRITHLGLVDVAVHGGDGRPDRLDLLEHARPSTKSPAWRIRSAERRRSTQASGSRRAPRGRCVSEMTARSTSAPRAAARGRAARPALARGARGAAPRLLCRTPRDDLVGGPRAPGRADQRGVPGRRRRVRVPVVEVDARDPRGSAGRAGRRASAWRVRRVLAATPGSVTLCAVAARDDAAGLGEPDLALDGARAAGACRSSASGWRRCSCAGPSTRGSLVRARGGTRAPTRPCSACRGPRRRGSGTSGTRGACSR